MKKRNVVSRAWLYGLSMLLTLGAWAGPARADTITWTNTAGAWDVPGNWSPNRTPTNGDDVLITNASASVVLSSSSSNLNSLTLGQTLTFTNWATVLTASNVTVLSNGYVTCTGPFTNTVMSNRVYIVCTNLTVASNGSINVNGKGYAGAATQSGVSGSGQGGGGTGASGAGHGGGGGYGGRGGSSGSGNGCGTYGVPQAAAGPGSGGGCFLNLGGASGAGGGSITIEAAGAVQLDGSMSANGIAAGQYAGGGSGGGIYIQCKTFSGAGPLSANGGGADSGSTGGGGGGGRVSVIYDPVAQNGTNNPTGVFSTAGGTAGWQNGDIGTLYFSDTRFLGTTTRYVGQLFSTANAWSVSSLLMTNSWLRFPQEGLRLTVTGNVVMTGSSRLDIGGNDYQFGIIPLSYYKYTLYNTNTTVSAFSVGGNVSLATNCAVYLYAGRTNASTPDYSLLMSVTGDVSIASNAWIYPVSQITNGGSSLLQMSNLTVAVFGGFNADWQGYYGFVPATGAGFGPGGGGYGVSGVRGAGGAGYGGIGGGAASSTGGGPWGLPEAPVQPGSCGGAWNVTYQQPGIGGGLIRIEATNAVTIDGTLTANGRAGGDYCGGGSGGGIYVRCKSISGSGTLRAIGGVGSGGGSGIGNAGGGAGGRIAVIYDLASQSATNNPTGVFSVAGGGGLNAGQVGDIGTLYFSDARFLSTTMAHVGQWMAPNFTSWSANSLLLTNSGWLRFPQEGFQLTVTNDVVIAGNSTLDIGPSASLIGPKFLLYNTGAVAAAFSVGGNVTLATGSVLRLYGARTNASTPDYGLLMSVTGDVSVASNAYIYSFSQITNGGSPLLRARNLTVALGGTMSADGGGFTASKGPGAGGSGGGGAYGGRGGNANGGTTYGSSNAPVQPGSSGGAPGTYAAAGYAGGLIRVQASGTVRIDGTVSANATRSPYVVNTPGASGGGIYLMCVNFQGGANGMLQANGANGNGTGGGGGGGRIAVSRPASRHFYLGNSSATAGTIGSPAAETGTVVMVDAPEPQGALILLR